MQPRTAVPIFVAFLLGVPACGSDDESDDDGGGTGAKTGAGGSQGTTCFDGYPTVGTACALPFEECKSCGNPPWACCDVFECQNGTWAQTASHLTCPEDAGVDAPADAEVGD